VITPRFFVETVPDGPGGPASGATLALPKAAAHHAARVLRLRAGDTVAIFNGHGGEYPARITAMDRDDVNVRVESFDPVEREAPLAITLMQGIAHGERMDSVIQKATELGVARIIPVACGRSVTRLDRERAEKRVTHWRGVAIAACEQCGRNRVPEILAPVTLEVAVASASSGARLLMSPLASTPLRSITQPDHGVTLLVGPEGGLTDAEESTAIAAGFQGIQLGPRVLRTETAGPAFIAALLTLHGDW
jgi:16S rRNA (uracil1498-N3)-methyltransferase